MITIAWDIDDVLNDLMRCWFEKKWLSEHQECKVKYEDIKENPPHFILSTSINEYLESLDAFRLSQEYINMKPEQTIMQWFSAHGANYRHVALTAVPIKTASVSAQWVLKNFGKWIRTFHFVPSNRPEENVPEYENNKADFLRWFGKVDIFIDDNMTNIRGAENAGNRSILIPRPWNNQSHSLQEVLSLITI